MFGITSLTYTPQPAQHWGIENQLHYCRDVTLGEDATRMKHTHQAQVVATLNYFVIALATYLGFSNIAAARRFFNQSSMYLFFTEIIYFGKSLFVLHL